MRRARHTPATGGPRLVRPPRVVHSARVTGRDWKRLAGFVVAARKDLGYKTRSHFARALDDVSERTLGNLERGQSVSRETLAAVERALDWEPGSAESILSGGSPRPMRASVPGADDKDLRDQLRRLWRSTTPERFFSQVSALAAEMESERRTASDEANETS